MLKFKAYSIHVLWLLKRFKGREKNQVNAKKNSQWRIKCNIGNPEIRSNYKQRYIAGFSKCSTKPLYLLLAKVLTVAKEKPYE